MRIKRARSPNTALVDDRFLIRKRSRASDLLRLSHELPVLSVCVCHRPLAVAAIVTQLVTRRAVTYYEEESTCPAPSAGSRVPLLAL